MSWITGEISTTRAHYVVEARTCVAQRLIDDRNAAPRLHIDVTDTRALAIRSDRRSATHDDMLADADSPREADDRLQRAARFDVLTR